MLRDEHRLPSDTDTCTVCMTPDCENVFHLFLRLQDEHGHAQITAAIDQNVRSLCQVLMYFCSSTCASRAAYSVASRLTT